METFHYEHKVEVLRGGEPVTFVHRRSYDAPEDHALHINNSVEVYVYIEGEADYIVEGAYYTLQPGDVMVMTPHQVHRTVLRQPCVYERFYLLLPVGAFSAFSADPVARLLARPADASATVRLRGADWDTAKGLLYRMDEACRRGEGLQSCALLLQLMSLLQAGAPAEKGTALQELPPLLRDILLYIDGNLASIRSVSAIAGHFHVTLPYVSALFSRHIGVPMGEYIRVRKVGLAKQLLDGGASVTFACYESGFGDCSYFIRCFKQYTGLTPLQYRRGRHTGV